MTAKIFLAIIILAWCAAMCTPVKNERTWRALFGISLGSGVALVLLMAWGLV